MGDGQALEWNFTRADLRELLDRLPALPEYVIELSG